MSNVMIIVDTGFVGGDHEADSGCTLEEWGALTDKEKDGVMNEVLWDFVSVYAKSEDGEIIE
jgi:hypothetical protein